MRVQMSASLLVVSIVTCFVLLGVLVYLSCYWYQGKASRQFAAPTGNELSLSTDETRLLLPFSDKRNYTEYQNHNWNFSLMVPNNWHITEDAQSKDAISQVINVWKGPKGTDSREGFTIQAKPNPDLHLNLDQEKKFYEAHWENVKAKDISINSHPATLITGDASPAKGNSHPLLVILLAKGSRYVEIEVLPRGDLFTDQSNAAIISSFKWID